MVDRGEADDKIISVLHNDRYYSNIKEISDLPDVLIERIRHYFSTYKLLPGSDPNAVVVERVYDRKHAGRVIEAAVEDYHEMFGE